MESNKSLHQHAQEYSDGKIKDIRDDLGQIHAVTQITSAAMVAGFAEQIAQLMESNRLLCQHAQEYSDGKIKSIRDDLGQIHAVTQITSATMVAGFAEQIAQLMESNKSLHQHAQKYSDGKIKDIRDDLGQIHAMTQITSTAMVQFTEGTQSVVENMAEAAQRMAMASQSMASGADKVGAGADELVNAIDAFKSQFTEVLDNVRRDLGVAIHDMSTQASETLERGSTQLGNATREISTALGVLSSDVKATMSEVKTSINKALEIQQRAANEFTVSSGSLNENIAATTEMVSKLTRPIEDGLRSVSDSGQHMRGIGKSLDKSIGSMEQIATNLVELPATLEPLRTLPSKQQELISALSPLCALPAQQQAILVELQKLSAISSVELPAALEPLRTLPNKQQELISALSPLGALTAQQLAILAELRNLRDDLSSYTKATKLADPVLTESD
jgi:methyl-accepting chemotaxis protein